MDPTSDSKPQDEPGLFAPPPIAGDLVPGAARPTLHAARLRHARHYAQVADRADRLYLAGGESVLGGLALFDRERAQIDAAWTWLQGQQEGAAIDEMLMAYADATAYIGTLRYDLRRERKGQLEAALSAAARRGHHAVQSMALNNLGLAYASLGETRQAIACYEQRLAIARERGDRPGEGSALNNLGNAYADLGEVRRAIDFYEQRLDIARELGDRRGEGQTLGNLGNAYRHLGELKQAITFYEQWLAIVQEMGDRQGEGQALGNLGTAYKYLDELEQATAFYEQRLAIAYELGDRQGEALGSWNLGLLLEEQGELARAIALMQNCVDYEQAIGHSNAEADAAIVEELRQQHEAAAGAAAPEGDPPA